MTTHTTRPTTTNGTRRRGVRGLALLAAGALAMATLASCSSDDKGTITIAHQAFGESEIVADIYGQVLEADGYTVKYQSFKDRSAIYAALESGDVQLVPEYAASALEFLNGNAGEASPEITPTLEKLTAQLTKKKLAAAKASDAVDTNSLVVTESTSKKDSITKISDLKVSMRLGGPQDCPTNASCIPALKSKYGMDFTSTFVPLDLAGPLTKKALANGDIDVAVLFSTDASIADKNWVVLKDDKGIFNADNIVPVGTAKTIDKTASSLDKISAKLTTANVTAMNKRYDIDKDDADTIAKDFIKEAGL